MSTSAAFKTCTCFFGALSTLAAATAPSCIHPHQLDSEYKELEHGRLGGSTFFKKVVPRFQHCSAACWYSMGCMSWSWSLTTMQCELHPATRIQAPGDFTRNQDNLYSHSLLPCQFANHPCGDRPCALHEICVPVKAGTDHICLSSSFLAATATAQQATTPRTTVTAAATTSVSGSPSSPTKTQTTVIPLTMVVAAAATTSVTTEVPSAGSTPATLETTTSTVTPETTAARTATPRNAAAAVQTATQEPATRTETVTPNTTAAETMTTTERATSTTSSSTPSVTTESAITYIGCYTDSVERLLPEDRRDSDVMTVAMCRDYCAGYAYFGIEVSWECHCGNSVNQSRLVADSECGTHCFGGGPDLCGGMWTIAVYTLTPKSG